MTLDPISERLELAKSAALEAGLLTLRYFRDDSLSVELKSDDSVVTIADRMAEELLRELIEETYPDDGIIGEERGTKDGTSGFTWVLDPIDGTQSFVAGVPLYGTLVGLMADGECVAGVLNMPALDEYAFALKGGGAFLSVHGGAPKPIRVSTTARLSDALVCTTSPHYFKMRDRLPAHQALVDKARTVRGWSDCYAFLLLASGRVDAVVEPVMNLWDGAAIKPIIEEAGGIYTDWLDNDVADGGDAVATNGRLHAELVALLRQARGQ